MLGGNASSEVRLWVLGATSHMGNNNRWAREGGVIDEILVENTFRNPEGNALVFDTVLLEKVLEEPNITLLLNTAVYEVEKAEDGEQIAAVRGFCSQNSTRLRAARAAVRRRLGRRDRRVPRGGRVPHGRRAAGASSARGSRRRRSTASSSATACTSTPATPAGPSSSPRPASR